MQITTDNKSAIDPAINSTDDLYDDIYEQPHHKEGLESFNISEAYFDDYLWLTSIKPTNWRDEAARLFSQPAYVVTLILCILALIMNIISIMAVKHIRSPITMHLKLIINLAVSDITIVIGVLIHILNKIFNKPFALGAPDPNDRLVNGCILAIVGSINVMTYLISLFNLIAISVDHYIAIMHPFSYRRIMSNRHGCILIIILWVTAVFGGFSNFIFGVFGYKKEEWEMFNYCEYIMYDHFHVEYLVFTLTFLCLTGISYIYLRIYCEVLKLRAHSCVPDNTFHNRKALKTTLLIIGTFCICWLPNCIFQIMMIIQLQVNSSTVNSSFDTFILISKYLYILQVTNSFLDPIIYAVRLHAVKIGYRNFLNRLKNYLRRINCIQRTKRGSLLNSSSRRATIEQTQATPVEMVLYASKCTSNHSTDLCESPTSNKEFFIVSEGSDINENELVTRVSIHSMETDWIPMLDKVKETDL